EHIRKNIPKGYGYHDHSREASYYQRSSAPRSSYAAPAPKPAPPAKPKAAPPVSSYAVGDRVEHTAFGAGTLSKMTPMGGDYLIEVAFDSVGTKKLMLRAAALHMKKL
ncbi:MAG: ATP-dependent DNA helicase PcrA, partial [Oscillospiraceae bacterium]|nr:ATP-dependent DNA helicase PcrA [Oscillospiraceae bacterium]